MGTLTRAIFEGDPPDTGPDSVRQNLQSEYVDRLLRIVNSGSYLPAAQAVAHAQVMQIRSQLIRPPSAEHRAFLLYKIKRGLDE